MVDKLDVEFVPLKDACTAFGLNKSSTGIQAQSLNNSRVGGSVHVNAEQVSRIVCKHVWGTSFLMIRWIGSVGAFRRAVMKQELCQTYRNIACATSTVTIKHDHSHTITHAHTTLIQMAIRTRLTCGSGLVNNQTVAERSFAVPEFHLPSLL